MKISNPSMESLQLLLPRIQQKYPGATLKKATLGPEVIMVPGAGFKYVLSPKKSMLKLDHTLPPLIAVIGAVGAGVAAWYFIGFMQNAFVGINGYVYLLALCVVMGALIGAILFGIKALFVQFNKKSFEDMAAAIRDCIAHS